MFGIYLQTVEFQIQHGIDFKEVDDFMEYEINNEYKIFDYNPGYLVEIKILRNPMFIITTIFIPCFILSALL